MKKKLIIIFLFIIFSFLSFQNRSVLAETNSVIIKDFAKEIYDQNKTDIIEKDLNHVNMDIYHPHNRVSANPEWTKVPSPVSVTLNSVSMLSSTSGWAVGDQGTILRWDGNTWMEYPRFTNDKLLRVAYPSENSAWATSYSRIYYWDGEEWDIRADAPSPYGMQSVFASGDEVWFAGGYGICDPECYDFMGKIMHWDGSEWSTYFTQHKELKSIFMTSPTNGWATGRYFLNQGFSPVITHWNGYGWEDAVHPEAYNLLGVSALSENSAWAVGADNVSADCMTLKWDGENWVQYPCPTDVTGWLFSVDMVAENDVWAAGNDITHWDGFAWSQVADNTGIIDIDMISSDNGWGVGYYGNIMHYTYNYEISGEITDQSNQPLKNVVINIFDNFDARYASVRSEIDGTYIIQGIHPGTYQIKTSKPCFDFLPSNIEVSITEDQFDVNFKAAPWDNCILLNLPLITK